MNGRGEGMCMGHMRGGFQYTVFGGGDEQGGPIVKKSIFYKCKTLVLNIDAINFNIPFPMTNSCILVVCDRVHLCLYTCEGCKRMG